MKLWQKIKQLLNINVDAVKDTAEAGKQVLELANAIQENEKDLAPLISNIDSLLDILNAPLAQAIAPGLPLIGIATGVLKYIVDKTREEPSLATSVLLVSQTAYLESFCQFFQQRPDIPARLQDNHASEQVTKEINELEKIDFNDEHARSTLVGFSDSLLAVELNEILEARLAESGLTTTEAHRVTQRISRQTHRYMKQVVVEVRDEASKLAGIYGDGWLQDLEAYGSIDNYLEEVIAKKPWETVFDEEFCFREIYVPLEVKPVVNGKINQNATAQNIETWAQDTLLDKNKQGQILFIQAGPGRGKSVFCRMFADWVRRELHPIYTPILIRLRDVNTFERNFEKTLAAAVSWDFVTSDSGWLTDRNMRFLFLLDGFDELLLERGASIELKQFLQQVESFQRRCEENSERGHRVLITGRPLALYGMERDMPINLARVEIVLMSEAIQEQWFSKWLQVLNQYYVQGLGENITHQFKEFICHQDCPEEVKTLAQEPLLLYLLAAMHRDGNFDLGMFQSTTVRNAKVLIYEAAVKWVLEKQRADSGRNLNTRMTGLDPEDLRSVLAEAALCVVQLGGEHAPIKMIETRLVAQEDLGAKEIIERARRENRSDGLKNALAAFYLKSVANAENYVEFFHKSFGEFLCAERIVSSFGEWTEKAGRRRKKYVVDTSNLEQQVYDLFGYGHLTPEIVEYIGALWDKNEEIDFVALFKRLNEFYLRWSDGEFIEATEDTLPQKKARELKRYGIEIGQRQVDIFTGLNVLILLFELHRFAKKWENLQGKISFHPCGNPDDKDEFDDKRLLYIIGYSECSRGYNFNDKLGDYLNHCDLRSTDLSSTNFFFANFSNTDLRNTNLSHIGLYATSLRNSDIRNTYFVDANLNDSDLRGANLNNTDLRGANLNNTDLSNANLYEVEWDNNTNWSNARGLHTVNNIPQTLAQHPNFASAVALGRGQYLAKEGQIDEAIDAYNQAQQINPQLEISAEFWNTLCWYGCIYNRVADVLFAGDKAVELKPNWGRCRDTRGVARALIGDTEGAIEDFQAALDSGYFDHREEEKQALTAWLAALRRGENPVTQEVLARFK